MSSRESRERISNSSIMQNRHQSDRSEAATLHAHTKRETGNRRDGTAPPSKEMERRPSDLTPRNGAEYASLNNLCSLKEKANFGMEPVVDEQQSGFITAPGYFKVWWWVFPIPHMEHMPSVAGVRFPRRGDRFRVAMKIEVQRKADILV